MSRNAQRFAFLSTVLFLAACGGSYVAGEPAPEEGNSGGSAGQGGSGGQQSGGSGGQQSGGFGGYQTGGNAGVGGDGGGMPDGGPQPTCGRTYDTFAMRAQLSDGRSFGCKGGKDQGYAELVGQVVDAANNSFSIDSCPPNADCMPMLSSFSFESPNLMLWMPTGSFVRIQLDVEQPWGCTEQIQVENLPTWAGLANPFSSEALLHLSAADGTRNTLTGSPFSVSTMPLGCSSSGVHCGAELEDDYALQFYSQLINGPGITVAMGQSTMWAMPMPTGSLQYLQVRNNRSFSTGYCDDYWNWSWTVTQAMLAD